MKLYFEIIIFILVAFVVFGFVLPMLFSAASTELVLIGVAILVLVIPGMFYGGKTIAKSLTERKETKE